MGRMYSVTAEIDSVAAAQDLIEVVAPSDAVVIIHSIDVTQDDDETSQQLEYSLDRANTSGSAGTTETARPKEFGDVDFGGGVESDNGTPAATLVNLAKWAENALNGLHVVFTPETRPVLSPANTGATIIVLRLITATVSPALNFRITIEFEEIGG